ncbi:hypothetical protein [uncultured Brachyspira sp.]
MFSLPLHYTTLHYTTLHYTPHYKFFGDFFIAKLKNYLKHLNAYLCVNYY